MHKQKIRVFLVDDHPIVIQGMKFLAESEEYIEIIDWAHETVEAIEKISKTKPDIVITDISLESISGLELTRSIVQKHPDIPVLVFSMHDEELYAERALLAGAKGYITKKATHKNLLVAIYKILEGQIYLSPEINNILLHKLYNKNSSDPDPLACLSNRELEVLQMTGQGLTSKEIANKLCISSSTVDTYKGHIKRKLNLGNSNELMRYAVRWIAQP